MKNKGITLVALVITIILLLILAGVVINLALGENGILQMSKRAAEEHKKAEMREKIELAIMDYEAKSIVAGEDVTVEGVLQELVGKEIFDSIDKEEKTGAIGEYDVKLGYGENGEVVIETIEKATGIRITYQLKPAKYTNVPKVDIVFKVTGKVKSVTKPDGHVSYPQNSEVALDYEVTANGTYIFKVENEEGVVTEKEALVDIIDMKAPVDFTITAEVQENGDVRITHTAKDAEADETSVCSGIEKIEYYLQKEGETTYTKVAEETNEENPYVGEDGIIHNLPSGTHKLYGVAIDKAGNLSNQTQEVEVKIKRIVPPEVGETGTTHEPHELIFDWEELEQIAKKISDNYGEEEGKINRNTAEVAVSINGKSQVIGIGDTIKLDGKTVTILGFNHDDLTNQDAEGNYQNAYGEGETNTKAGISFWYVEYLTQARMNPSNTNSGGWANTEMKKTTLPNQLSNLSIKNSIKEVEKEYIATYNKAASKTKSHDKLWLLSCGEIWNNGKNGGATRGVAITEEGQRYKYFEVNVGDTYYMTGTKVLRKNQYYSSYRTWHLRSPGSYNNLDFANIGDSGEGGGMVASYVRCVYPGFCI